MTFREPLTREEGALRDLISSYRNPHGTLAEREKRHGTAWNSLKREAKIVVEEREGPQVVDKRSRKKLLNDVGRKKQRGNILEVDLLQCILYFFLLTEEDRSSFFKVRDIFYGYENMKIEYEITHLIFLECKKQRNR